jgi:hypothetical protein
MNISSLSNKGKENGILKFIIVKYRYKLFTINNNISNLTNGSTISKKRGKNF